MWDIHVSLHRLRRINIPPITRPAFHPRFNTQVFIHTSSTSIVEAISIHTEPEGNHLTCFLRGGPKPSDEPQQEASEADLEAEQLLSLSPPGFTPPPVQHHSRSSSSGHGPVGHPLYHRAGHGALVGPSGPAARPVVVVQGSERAKRAEKRSDEPGERFCSRTGATTEPETSVKTPTVTSQHPDIIQNKRRQPLTRVQFSWLLSATQIVTNASYYSDKYFQ